MREWRQRKLFSRRLCTLRTLNENQWQSDIYSDDDFLKSVNIHGVIWNFGLWVYLWSITWSQNVSSTLSFRSSHGRRDRFQWNVLSSSWIRFSKCNRCSVFIENELRVFIIEFLQLPFNLFFIEATHWTPGLPRA